MMIQYNANGIFSKAMEEHKLSLFSRVFMMGEEMRVPSPVRTTGPCPTAPLVVQGSVELINEQDSNYSRIVHGGPGKVFPEEVVPGIFKFTVLEDNTIYTCLTPNDPELSPMANAFKYDWDFTIETQSLSDLNTAFTVAQGGKTTVIVCLHGVVVVESSGHPAFELQAGEHYDLEEDQIVTISLSENSTTFAEVAWPQGLAV